MSHSQLEMKLQVHIHSYYVFCVVELSVPNDVFLYTVAGEHYESVPGIMTFNECEKICVGIPILDDDMVERVTTHTFSIHLHNDSRTKIDQNAEEATVVISDNERCKY